VDKIGWTEPLDSGRLDGFGLSGRALMFERNARGGKLLALRAVDEKAVMANAHEARGQDMQKEAADAPCRIRELRMRVHRRLPARSLAA
jgi:hypothetical protein